MNYYHNDNGDDHSMVQLQNGHHHRQQQQQSPPVSPSSQTRESFALPPNELVPKYDTTDDDLLLGLSQHQHYSDIPAVIYICKQDDDYSTKASTTTATSSNKRNKLRVVKVSDIIEEDAVTRRTRKSTGTETSFESTNVISETSSHNQHPPHPNQPRIVTQKWGNTYFF